MAQGDGYLVCRNGIFYAVTYQRGRKVRETLKTRDPEVAAKRLLALRRKRDLGTYVTPQVRRVTVGELLDELLVHLEVRGVASLDKARSTLKAVRSELGHCPALELDTASIERSQKTWLDEGRRPATVNRRCELLRQAYRLAARHTPPKVAVVPHIPLLRVQNARQGFVGPGEFSRLVAAIPDPDVRDFVEWCGWTGMRPGEARQITWEMVDLEGLAMRLDPRAAKTREGRTIALTGPLLRIVRRRLKSRRLGCELVFHRSAHGKDGQPVKDYRKMWRLALKEARLPLTLLPYDLRRSALRNMVRAGVDFTVAMKISGHKTRSTFDRYNIVDEVDIRAALGRTAAYVEKKRPR